MSEIEMPRNLLSALDEDDDWLTSLPGILGELSRRWSLQLDPPFQPGGSASWVAPARDAAGQRLVLKVGRPHSDALEEPDGLRTWNGDGVVRVLDVLAIDGTTALLLERCEPGTALADALAPLEQDAVVATLLRRLWIEPPVDHPFRSLQGMCHRWADMFEEKFAAAADTGDRLDPGLARAGIELFRSLPATAEHSLLLCTDLHPENVLAARREPWLVIDPKPHVGDPTYDALQHMLNFPHRLRVDAAGFARRMAQLLDLDAARLHQWLFARCVQESIDQPHLRVVAAALAP